MSPACRGSPGPAEDLSLLLPLSGYVSTELARGWGGLTLYLFRGLLLSDSPITLVLRLLCFEGHLHFFPNYCKQNMNKC